MTKFSGGKTLAVVAVAGGAILASIAPVMADVSAESPSVAAIRVESPAKIKALGAAVEIQVTYACPKGSQASLNLNVSQTVIGGVANGGAYKSSINCTGAFETITMNVAAQNRAFRWGTAFVAANINGYPPSYSASDERVIDFRF
ncbi:hypothetical protein C8D88_1011762 [Lentzea atacamensis]|nr:hypothetical protein [Lentzea atacamensis]PWK91723.1 hypothetical protein C8D88_1011762 [Lentzea atacamensis]